MCSCRLFGDFEIAASDSYCCFEFFVIQIYGYRAGRRPASSARAGRWPNED
jgi:hypothetical protein